MIIDLDENETFPFDGDNIVTIIVVTIGGNPLLFFFGLKKSFT